MDDGNDEASKPMGSNGAKTKSTSRREQSKTFQHLTIGCWYIRRGLIKCETELKNILETEKINIMFLVETDVILLNGKEDYKLEGFSTVITNQDSADEKIRVLGLVHEDLATNIKVREDLMSKQFPSIWLELQRESKKNVLIGGFYREWTREGNKTEEGQIQRLKILLNQMEAAAKEEKCIIMLGDANLCAHQWANENYRLYNVSAELRCTLSQCGMEILDVGKTYLADRLKADGSTIESALDHIYTNGHKQTKITGKKLSISATDHVPIIAQLIENVQQNKEFRKIRKRCMKNFTQEKWVNSLVNQQWEDLAQTDNIHEMTNSFNINLQKALDESAPWKCITIHKNYKHGLSDQTKKLIKERDQLRKSINKSPNENKILHEKYKKIRNCVINQIRKETKRNNEERIDKAGNTKEIWNIVNDIIKPREQNSVWKLQEGEKLIVQEEEIADSFNKFFVEKIEILKEGIDRTLITDPLEKLATKMKSKNLKFSIRTVTEKKVLKAICSLKKKKSSGADGISQEQLVLGANALAVPLTRIINTSIINGEFPDVWKEAIVTPILKKGDATKKENYRPVSCLPVASKVLEKIVCDQITRFMEIHNLLPENQHGFRSKRSTMTALEAMQYEWAQNSENKLKTGILFWDLSAAYDTLSPDLFCDKIKIYGFDNNACKWFKSFLTDRSQRVKIKQAVSSPAKLESGVPQGGILSPIIFIIYGADMEAWIKHSSIYTYADDTSSSCQDQTETDVIKKLEEDAAEILKFMASNGLVANSSKTVFMMLNSKQTEETHPRKIKVGKEEVTESDHAKVLGMAIDSNQKWKSHIYGNKGLISSLNQRLFLIRRIINHLPVNKIAGIVDGIWSSKLRYGLQLFSEVRLKEESPHNKHMSQIQKAQNKLLRVICGVTLSDRNSIKSLLYKANLLSVNQMSAQVKLTEIWKVLNDPLHPIKIQSNVHRNGMETRSVTHNVIKEWGTSTTTEKSFIGSAIRLWNKVPDHIKCTKTLGTAKSAIKEFCKTLPV